MAPSFFPLFFVRPFTLNGTIPKNQKMSFSQISLGTSGFTAAGGVGVGSAFVDSVVVVSEVAEDSLPWISLP